MRNKAWASTAQTASNKNTNRPHWYCCLISSRLRLSWFWLSWRCDPFSFNRRQMPYFGTLSRIYTKLVCATVRCTNKLYRWSCLWERRDFWAVGKHFYHLRSRRNAGFYSRIPSINAGIKSAHYQSSNAARLVCSRHGYGVEIFVKMYAFIRK